MAATIATPEDVRAIVREELERALGQLRPAPAPLVDWVTPAQAAPRLRVDEKTVRRWCESGRIRAERHGSRWRIDRAALPAEQPGTPEAHAQAAVVALRR